MELDVNVGGESLSIPISNPHRLDLDSMVGKIADFLSSKQTVFDEESIRGLLPQMVKGIAGCEKGCPADAKRLVSRGYGKFDLEYIEGGILSARTLTDNGKPLWIKLFPDF